MRNETRRRLEDFFRDDVEELSGILGRDMVELWFPSSTSPQKGPQVGSAGSA